MNQTKEKCCANCICSRVEIGFRTGFKYRYCYYSLYLDEPYFWGEGESVCSDDVCEHWRGTR